MAEPTFILDNTGPGFGHYGPEDDALHPEMNAAVDNYALTETQYFGFQVPEHGIHGLSYLWCHPNLRSVTGGVIGFKGYKGYQLSAEMFDMRSYMSDAVLADGLASYTLDNGYSVDIIEPLKKMRTRYADEARGNALDVTYTAVTPPAMLPNRKHFDQVMRSQGSVTLRGKEYRVDGYNIRDRSWAEARSEAPAGYPPIAWMTGVFGEDFAFNCMCAESPSEAVEWKSIFQNVSEDSVLKGGWIYKDGTFKRLVKAVRLTNRDAIFLQPRDTRIVMTDEDGRVFTVHGEVTASINVTLWPNATVVMCMTRWVCAGRVGWGDAQEIQWTDFVRGRFGATSE